MRKSKYPALHRLITELQETLGVKPVDGFIGAITEKALARALTRYDGNDVIGFLADYAHHQVEHSKDLEPKHDAAEPLWYTVAKGFIGLEEIVGSKHNEEILQFWKDCKLPFRDDETPWCAGFVGGILERSGIRSTRSGMARSYLKWGKEIAEPSIGCVVVFWRNGRYSTSGHVGFVAGDISGGFIPVLGGNQGNRVSIKFYPVSRVLGYRLPA